MAPDEASQPDEVPVGAEPLGCPGLLDGPSRVSSSGGGVGIGHDDVRPMDPGILVEVPYTIGGFPSKFPNDDRSGSTGPPGACRGSAAGRRSRVAGVRTAGDDRLVDL